MAQSTWVTLPLEDAYDTMGRRRRPLSRTEEAVMAIGDGDVNTVRTGDGTELKAVYYTEGHGEFWLPCDDDGEPLPDSDGLDVIAVRV